MSSGLFSSKTAKQQEAEHGSQRHHRAGLPWLRHRGRSRAQDLAARIGGNHRTGACALVDTEDVTGGIKPIQRGCLWNISQTEDAGKANVADVRSSARGWVHREQLVGAGCSAGEIECAADELQ